MDYLDCYKQSMSIAVQSASEDDIVVKNLPLVVYLANRFASKNDGLDIEELVGYGNLGLLKAAENFSESRGIRFSTYAATIIEREFLKHFIDLQNRGCRIPKKTFEQVQIVTEFVEEHGHTPNLEELEELLDRKVPLSKERFREIINAYKSTLPYANELKDI